MSRKPNARMIICLGCGATISAYSGGRPRQHCNAECRRRAAGGVEDSKCHNPHCAKEIVYSGFGAPSRYCSPECKAHAAYLRYKEHKKEKKQTCITCRCTIPDQNNRCARCYLNAESLYLGFDGAGI